MECPFTEADLIDAGFRGHSCDVVQALGGVDAAGTGAALRVAIAERVHRPPPRLDLVWTGPEAQASVAQSTGLVVERLFGKATASVLVGGYSFDSPDMLRPLHRAMTERHVSVTLFMDIDGDKNTGATAEVFATGSSTSSSGTSGRSGRRSPTSTTTRGPR